MRMPQDTSPGDDPTPGEMIDDWVGVARGTRSARWRGGRFRNPGAQKGCGSTAMVVLVLISATAAAVARGRSQ